MKITNDMPPGAEAVYDAICNDTYEHGKPEGVAWSKYFTPSSLLTPPQIALLKREYGSDLEEPASARVWALMGQAVHTVLERAGKGELIEARLHAELDGYTIGAQVDRYDARILSDYKLCSVWEYIYGLKDEREQQFNVQAWILRKNGYAVDVAQAVMIFRDWSAQRAKQGGDYPQTQVAAVPVRLWSDDEVEQFIRERIALHEAARREGKAVCTPEDQWAKPDTWAVMKNGRKSALRVLDSQEAASDYLANNGGDYIDHRPGERTRCEMYCPVASVCPQFNALEEAA